MFRALLHIFALMALAVPAFGQIYKWVDEKGVTHYEESSPPGREAIEFQKKPETPGPEGPPRADELPQKDREFRQRQIQSQETQDKQQKEAARREEQCKQQRDLLARLKQNGRTTKLNEKGERAYMDDAERDSAIARQEKLVVERCKS